MFLRRSGKYYLQPGLANLPSKFLPNILEIQNSHQKCQFHERFVQFGAHFVVFLLEWKCQNLWVPIVTCLFAILDELFFYCLLLLGKFQRFQVVKFRVIEFRRGTKPRWMDMFAWWFQYFHRSSMVFQRNVVDIPGLNTKFRVASSSGAAMTC